MYLPDPASQSLGGGVRRECRCRRTGRWDRRCAVQSSPSLLTVQRTWNLPLLDEAFDSCCQSGFCTIFAILSTPSRVCFATRARAWWCRSYEWARLRTAPTGMEKELPRLHTSLRTRGCRRAHGAGRGCQGRQCRGASRAGNCCWFSRAQRESPLGTRRPGACGADWRRNSGLDGLKSAAACGRWRGSSSSLS